MIKPLSSSSAAALGRSQPFQGQSSHKLDPTFFHRTLTDRSETTGTGYGLDASWVGRALVWTIRGQPELFAGLRFIVLLFIGLLRLPECFILVLIQDLVDLGGFEPAKGNIFLSSMFTVRKQDSDYPQFLVNRRCLNRFSEPFWFHLLTISQVRLTLCQQLGLPPWTSRVPSGTFP